MWYFCHHGWCLYHRAILKNKYFLPFNSDGCYFSYIEFSISVAVTHVFNWFSTRLLCMYMKLPIRYIIYIAKIFFLFCQWRSYKGQSSTTRRFHFFPIVLVFMHYSFFKKNYLLELFLSLVASKPFLNILFHPTDMSQNIGMKHTALSNVLCSAPKSSPF